MNLTRKNTFLFLIIYAHLLLASGCKSAVSTRPKAIGGAAKSTSEKEMTPVKPEDRYKAAATEESMKLNAIAALKIMKENAPKVRLNEFFNAIANADNAITTNSTITKALTMFASFTTAVLIELPDQNGKHMDAQSTTILAYLNSLKAQRKNLDDIKNLKMDARGKIIQVELKRTTSVPIQ